MAMRLTMIILLVFAGSSSAQVKISADISELSYEMMGFDYEAEAATGFDLSYDHMLGQRGSLSYGVGAEYQFMRELKDDDANGKGTFGFSSLYGVAQYDIYRMLYAKAKIGYAVLFYGNDDFTLGGDLKGGITFGTGVGCDLTDRVLVEVLLHYNKGEITDRNFKADVEYVRLNIGIGYDL